MVDAVAGWDGRERAGAVPSDTGSLVSLLYMGFTSKPIHNLKSMRIQYALRLLGGAQRVDMFVGEMYLPPASSSSLHRGARSSRSTVMSEKNTF